MKKLYALKKIYGEKNVVETETSYRIARFGKFEADRYLVFDKSLTAEEIQRLAEFRKVPFTLASSKWDWNSKFDPELLFIETFPDDRYIRPVEKQATHVIVSVSWSGAYTTNGNGNYDLPPNCKKFWRKVSNGNGAGTDFYLFPIEEIVLF